MRKGLLTLCMVFLCSVSMAQRNDGNRLMARANVAAYDDEDAIVKSAYRESPYYQELTGRWDQKQTDSSRIYSREIEVEKYWKDYRVFLNVRCGRACRVTLNGKVVGYGDDSRHWNEFLLNGFLKYGKRNVLAIEALKHADGALLEDASLEVGLNGEPYLLFKNDPNIADLLLSADYEAATASGTLSIDATVFNSRKKGRHYLEVELWDPQNHSFDRMGRWVVFDKKSEVTVDMSRSWTDVVPWSAETPVLYTAVLRLRNEDMDVEEVVGMRFGFRRVEVDDGLLKVNGLPVTLKGVLFQQEVTGDYSSREQLRSTLLSLKRNNINAIRTTLSPQVPAFYELCDELGLYVVCDANLMPVSSQRQAVATDKEFIPLFERRVENLYGKYKNYTSILAWSLGDTRDNGVCMAAAYKRLKAIEKSRPIIFSGAEFSENSDVIAFINPDPQQLRQATTQAGQRPLLVLAAPADAYDLLWQRVQNTRTLQGAFVGMPDPQILPDLKNLYSPFDVRLSKQTIDDAEFNVYNRNDFADFSNYILEYTIYTNLRSSISGGDLPLAIAGGGVETAKLRIPPVKLEPGEEMFVRFDLSQRQKGRVVASSSLTRLGTVAIPLKDKNIQRKSFANSGKAVSLLDEDFENIVKLHFVGHEDWIAEKVAVAQRNPDSSTACVDAMLQYLSAGTPMCYARVTYSFFGTGDIVIDYTLSPTDAFRGTLVPQLVVGQSQRGDDTLVWFGLDRESHFSQHLSGVPGTYREARAKLDGSSRRQVRWCACQSQNDCLYYALLDRQFTLNVGGEKLTFTPDGDSRSFRFHMRLVENPDSPEDFYAVEMPVVKTGIVDPPKITASQPRFSQPLTVTVTSQVKGDIRYTLDGSEPTETSALYDKPLTLTTTTVVKARVFAKEMPPSFTATRKFSYDHILSTSFSRKPNTPFNVGTDTILFDGLKSSVDDLQHGWLGFSGNGVVATVNLAKTIDIDYVVLRYAHVPDNWAFSPRQVDILLSSDGQNYSDTLHVAVPFDPSLAEENTPRVVEIRVPVNRNDIQSLKIDALAIDAVPAWHRAKGLKPWLLMDEIEVSERIIGVKRSERE